MLQQQRRQRDLKGDEVSVVELRLCVGPTHWNQSSVMALIGGAYKGLRGLSPQNIWLLDNIV